MPRLSRCERYLFNYTFVGIIHDDHNWIPASSDDHAHTMANHGYIGDLVKDLQIMNSVLFAFTCKIHSARPPRSTSKR